jgi:hypothetical protein
VASFLTNLPDYHLNVGKPAPKLRKEVVGPMYRNYAPVLDPGAREADCASARSNTDAAGGTEAVRIVFSSSNQLLRPPVTKIKPRATGVGIQSKI